MDTIKIGSGASYRLVQDIKGCGIWSKTLPNGKESWIVGKVPEARHWDAIPTSVLAEFTNLPQAAAALERWSLDSLPPKGLPKARKKLGALRRNRSKPRPEKVNPNQLAMPL